MAATVIGDLFVRLGVDATALSAGLTAAEKRLDRFGTQLFFLGSRVTAGVSIPVGLALAKIEEFGSGFDRAMTESLAIMDNVTAGMRQSMENVAKSVSASTKFSSQEAAEGYYDLASAGLSAQASMGALPIAAKFAQAGVMDLSKATEFLAGAQASLSSGFQTSSQQVAQMAEIADVLTMANNRAQGTVQDFAEALTNRAGAALRQTNKSVYEGVAVLAAYAEQNIKGKAAGQQLWMVIRDLGTYALKNADAFKRYGISVFDSQGAMRNMALIIKDVEVATANMSDAQKTAMFVQLGIPLRSVAATKALIGYSGAIRDHEAALRQAAGTTDEVSNKQMLGFQNRMAALGHSFQNAAIDLFKSFIPAIEQYFIPLVKSAADAAHALVGALDMLPAPVKALLLGLAGVAVVIGPVVAAIGSMTLLGSAALRGIGLLGGGLGKLAVTMGLAVGVSTNLTKYLTMMPSGAAAAAAAAYDLAKAQGQSGFMLNRAATAAANAAGWTGKITNASVAASVAQAEMNGTMLTGLSTFARFNIVTAVLGGTILATQAYTKDWGETMKIALIPGYGLFTLLTDLNNKMIQHGGVLGDVGRILRDTVIIQYDKIKKTLEIITKAFETTAIQVKAVFSGLFGDVNQMVFDQLSKAAVIASLLPGGEETMHLIVKMMGALPGLRKELNLVANAMDKTAGYGTYKGKGEFVPDMLTSGFKPWAMPSGKQGFGTTKSPFNAAAFNEGGMPDDLPKQLSAAQQAAKTLSDQWQENSKQVRAFKDAWSGLTAAQKQDSSILDHVWESYDKLRQTQGVLIPQFEEMFQQQIKQQEIAKNLPFILNEWGVVWSDAAIKMEDETGRMYLALTNLRDKASLDAFWKKNAQTIEELIPFYNQLNPMLQAIVNRYQQWAAATDKVSSAQDDLQAKASRAIGDYAADAAAKLIDVRSELSLFTKSYAEKELVGLKKGLAQQELAREQAYNEQLANLAAFAGNPALFAVEFARLQSVKRINEQIRDTENRLGLSRIAQSVGVNKHIIDDFDKMTITIIKDIIRQRVAWNDLMNTMSKFAEATGSIGDMFSTAGFGEAGKMLTDLGSALGAFNKGAEEVANADTMGEYISGFAQMITNAIKSFQALKDVGSRSMRALGGAVAGAQMGMTVAGPWGALVGGAVGGIAGMFMADPGWKNVQKTVSYKWNTSVSKALADQIDKDATALGGHVNAMLMHLVDIANEHGGLSAGNVGTWAHRLAEVFPLLERGMMSSAQAAKTLDASFTDLVNAGTTTNGFISDQIRELVQLERRYNTGSAAIHEFVDAQLGLVSKGFTDVVGGAFGALLPEGSFDVSKSMKKQKTLIDQISEVKDRIIEINEKDNQTEAEKLEKMSLQFQLVQLQNNLLREQNKIKSAGNLLSQMSGPQGQESFDRLGRLASVTFDAMIGSGKTFIETLDAIGPSLDMLSAAQDTFGFTASEAFQELMKFRQFSTLNPELVAELSGLQNMMRGLTNLGFITQESFSDLGAEATDVFGRLVNQGLTSDQALKLMQPTLQTLWELEHKFGYKADEATQALLDQAEASGAVGEAHMSATDRMILGIDTLIDRFDRFLHFLGIDIPKAAGSAADAVNTAGDNINPWDIDVNYHGHGFPNPDDTTGQPEPTLMAEGGVLTRPTHVIAGEAGPEAFIPLDKLFAEIQTMNAKQDGGDGYMPVTIIAEGETLVRTVVRVAKKHGWR